MRRLYHATGFTLAAGCILLGACVEDASEPTLAPTDPAFATASAGSSSFTFEPLAASAVCVANGSGDRFDLPAGFTQDIVTRESDIAGLIAGSGEDLFDMLTLNENGPHAGRYLYRTHEVGSNGAVTRTDLQTLETILISQRADYRRLDGIAWTQWGTLLFAEETGGGRIFEYFPNTGEVVERPNMGLRSHEGIRLDPQGNVYGISETSPGYIYKFVPTKHGDLSSGSLYALNVESASRTGAATWAKLNIEAHNFNSDAAAAAVGATGWGRPEDVEIGTSTGNNKGGANVMYVAMTSENLVLRVVLQGDNAYVSNFIAGVAGLNNPDNLALSPSGDLYVAEDNGPGDLWVAETGPEVATRVVRFASLRDCGAEPTGIYFDRNGRTLFVQVQHARWEGGDDLTVAIRPAK